MDLVERLREIAGNGKINIFAEAADRIEDLEETLDGFMVARELLRKRDGYKRYLAYWREQNGKSDLCYPDGDQVYKDFWEMKERCEDLEHVVADLKCVNTDVESHNETGGYWVFDKDANDWGIGGYRCSECGAKNDNLGIRNTRIPIMAFVGSKYCPNCGAKMLGERGSENERC